MADSVLDSVTRRNFVTGLTCVGLAGTAEVASAAAATEQASAPTPITAATIAEAEKLHAVSYTAGQRNDLALALTKQVQGVSALRDIPRSASLQPATHFDPRLPGKSYRTQGTGVHLAQERMPQLPDNDEDIAFATVKQLGHWIRSKQLTSARLTDLYLERIARYAAKLSCYITVTEELARQQASEMDAELARGRYRGPLHGIPYSLKDLFDTAGIPTTWGCSLYRNRRPTQDAAVVQRLREAGAVLLGKASMGELAYAWEWFGGACRNPWNAAEPAGGSSAGSAAATAAGLCAFSIGT
ncbi:MAG TPA: amidase, partial [Steroidobacteraceae bacterium]|nr:amidase [Steroidobacteraceae bacterium]